MTASRDKRYVRAGYAERYNTGWTRHIVVILESELLDIIHNRPNKDELLNRIRHDWNMAGWAGYDNNDWETLLLRVVDALQKDGVYYLVEDCTIFNPQTGEEEPGTRYMVPLEEWT